MESRGMYHRDVSLGNIFTRRLHPETADPRGWLDDFDCMYAENIGTGDDLRDAGDDVNGRDALSVCLTPVGHH
jgi:hypothetical protein